VTNPVVRHLPPGSALVEQWARYGGLGYEARPDEVWFRRWEPHDTIAPPAHFLNSCTWIAQPGHMVVVEPWYAPEDGEPLERGIIAFAVHPGLQRRAAIRVGEYFLTRVAFLESPPPPQVEVGDALWDAHVKTFAKSERDAAIAFHPRLRKLLSGWGFQGHLELREGGLVVYYAGLQPTPEGYDRLTRITKEIVNKAVAYP